MMHRVGYGLVVLVVTCQGLAAAAGLRMQPAEIVLTGPHTRQQVLVLTEENGRLVADVTGDARFVSSNPAVAVVSEDGVIKTVADGEAVITATHEGRQATVKVKVTRTKE